MREALLRLHQTFMDVHAAVAAASPPLKDAAGHIFIDYLLQQPLDAQIRSCFIEELDAALSKKTAMPLHSFGMSIRAVNMLGLQRPASLCLQEHRMNSDRALRWLEQRDWQEGSWRSSIEVLHAFMPLLEQGLVQANDFFPVLEQFQTASGGWGSDTPHRQMGTAFHFVPLYRYCQRPMPRLQQLADYVLREEPADGGFGAMDALYILYYASDCSLIRRSDMHLNAWLALLQSASFADRHALLAAVQTLALLESLVTGSELRDGWHPRWWSM